MSNFVESIKKTLQLSLNRCDQLVDAVKHDKLEKVRLFLLSNEFDVNKTSSSGATPLLCAIQSDSLSMVELLLEKGADVNIPSITGATPLLFASQKGRLAIVSAILKCGANINEQNKPSGSTPLIISAQNGYLDIVQMLVEKGADVNQADKKAVTPLLVSVKNNHNPIVIYLIESGAKSASKNKSGISPIKIAQDEKNPAMISLLHKWKFMKQRGTTPAKSAKKVNIFSYMEGI